MMPMSPNPESPSSHRSVLPGIQVLRWLAAMAVVCRHLLAGFHFNGLELGPLRGLNIGLWGVDLFFVISGFIMVVTTQRQPPTLVASARFMLRRYLRLSPLYYLLSACAVLALVIKGPHAPLGATVSHVLASLLYLPHRDPQGGPMPVLGIGWSLNFEMYFYVVFALLMATGRLLPWMLAWCVGMVLLGQAISFDAMWWWQVSNPLLIAFTLGVLAAHGWISGRLPRWLSGRAALVALLAIAALDLYLPVKLDAHRIVFAVLATVAVLGMAQAPVATWARFQTWRGLVRLGDDSYALYLAHTIVLYLGIKLFKPWGAQGGAQLTGLAILLALASLGLARLLHEGFEHPMHLRTNAWVKKHWPAP
jgi:exopolysaccharide production protein ExoZ